MRIAFGILVVLSIAFGSTAVVHGAEVTGYGAIDLSGTGGPRFWSDTQSGSWGTRVDNTLRVDNGFGSAFAFAYVAAHTINFRFIASGYSAVMNGEGGLANVAANVRVVDHVRPRARNRPAENTVRLEGAVTVSGSLYRYGNNTGLQISRCSAGFVVEFGGGEIARALARRNQPAFDDIDFPSVINVPIVAVNRGDPQDWGVFLGGGGLASSGDWEDPDSDGGFASDYSHTLTWQGIVSAYDETAGEPIPLEDVEMIGDDGLDWAHPDSLFYLAGVKDFHEPVRSLTLAQPWPNPAFGDTHIQFSIPSGTNVRVEVFDVLGRLVSSPVDGLYMEAGPHQVIWDGRDVSGRHVATGIYGIRVEAGGSSSSRRIAVVQ